MAEEGTGSRRDDAFWHNKMATAIQNIITATGVCFLYANTARLVDGKTLLT